MSVSSLTSILKDEIQQKLNNKERSFFVRFLKDWEKKIGMYDTESPKLISYSIGNLSGKISFILVPLVASEGLVIPQIVEPKSPARSSLYDYFHSFFGAKTSLSAEELGLQLSQKGAAVFSVPPLIVSYLDKLIKPIKNNESSISKAHFDSLVKSIIILIFLSRADGVLFDIRIGGSSFLQEVREARYLARSLKKICVQMNIRSSFIMVNMNQPLGKALGGSLDINECIEILKGEGPLDVLKLALELATEMLLMGRTISDRSETKKCLRQKIKDGNALEKLEEILESQKGRLYLDDKTPFFPTRGHRIGIFSAQDGYLHKLDMKKISYLYNLPKIRKGKRNGPYRKVSGLLILKKIGDRIKKGDRLAEIHWPSPKPPHLIQKDFQDLFLISSQPPEFQPLIIERWREKEYF